MLRLRILIHAARRNPLQATWTLVKIPAVAGLLYIVVAASIYNISHDLFPLWTDIAFLAFFGLGMLVGLIQVIADAVDSTRDYLKPMSDQAEGPGFMPYQSIEAYNRSRETARYGQPVLF